MADVGSRFDVQATELIAHANCGPRRRPNIA
jgi:hypothetical protein